MKLSVSLPDEDVEFLDGYAKAEGIESRSAALQQAIRLLRTAEMGGMYIEAWQEWHAENHSKAWDSATGDGLSAQ